MSAGFREENKDPGPARLVAASPERAVYVVVCQDRRAVTESGKAFPLEAEIIVGETGGVFDAAERRGAPAGKLSRAE